MIEQLDRLWRTGATGVCFALFGLGGLGLRFLVFPTLSLSSREPARRSQLARRWIRGSFRLFVGLMSTLGVLSYELHGFERLRRRGLLVLANHPSLIDVVFLMAFIDHADCVVKAALLNNPFTRGPVRATGYICNDSGPELIDQCIASLRAGNNLILFPEGTRTAVAGSRPLRRGAANVAVRGECDITPVLIRCEPPTLGKGGKWYRVPPRRVHYRLEVRDDIRIDDFLAPGSPAIAARRLTRHLQEFFARETTPYA